jgi:hypothetical protein
LYLLGLRQLGGVPTGKAISTECSWGNRDDQHHQQHQHVTSISGVVFISIMTSGSPDP